MRDPVLGQLCAASNRSFCAVGGNAAGLPALVGGGDPPCRGRTLWPKARVRERVERVGRRQPPGAGRALGSSVLGGHLECLEIHTTLSRPSGHALPLGLGSDQGTLSDAALLGTWIRRDFRTRYSQTLFGGLWAIAQP